MQPRRHTFIVAAAAALAGLGITVTTGPSSTAASGSGPGTPVLPGGSPGVGAWTVVPSGPGQWDVSWRSPDRLPLSSDRPTVVASGRTQPKVGVPTVAPDGRTVLVTIASDTRPDPADLDVVLSGRLLDEPGSPAASARPARTPARWSTPKRTLLPDDPAARGDLAVTTKDYQLPSITIDGLPRKVEMVGHVVEPTDADPSHPLVLFLHGRHDYCYNPGTGRSTYRWPCGPKSDPVPSQLGYDYVQRRLASQGFVTVSIAANGINAQDGELLDGGASARAALVEAHLDTWASWAGSTEQVDLRHVVLIGHSRGGEGVSRASLEIPLSAPYRIVGQVLLAPTNFARQTTPYVPTVTVLPSCDGDVSDLQGQVYTDVSRGLADHDTSLKSSVLVIGANHNFFNTQWTPGLADGPAFDDWGSHGGVCGTRSDLRLSPREERAAGRAYLAGAVRTFTGDARFTPMYDGSAVRVASTGSTVVLSHALRGGPAVRAPGASAVLTTPVHASTSICRGTTPYDGARGECGRFARDSWVTPHWPTTGSLTPTQPAFELSWTQAGGRGGFRFSRPLDASSRDRLDLRTIVDPQVGDVAVDVTVTDADGHSATATPERGGRLPALPQDKAHLGKYWAQTLRVDTADLTGVDLSALTSVELTGRSARGRVWVLDVAGTNANLAPVPVRRIALLDLGDLQVQEGDGGAWTAHVPYTVTGSLRTPAEIRVDGVDEMTGERDGTFRVPVTRGTTHGSLGWPVDGNTMDDLERRVTLLGHALHDVMVRDYFGSLRVEDDDPTPKVSVHLVDDTVREGEDAVWTVRLAAPVGYPVGVTLQSAAGDGTVRSVDKNDLGRRWTHHHVFCEGSRPQPLSKCEIGYWKEIPPGSRTIDVRVPIRADGTAEPREELTLQVLGDQPSFSFEQPVLIPRSN